MDIVVYGVHMLQLLGHPVFLMLIDIINTQFASFCEVIALNVVLLDSWFKSSNVPCVRSLTIGEETMRPSRWFHSFNTDG